MYLKQCHIYYKSLNETNHKNWIKITLDKPYYSSTISIKISKPIAIPDLLYTLF